MYLLQGYISSQEFTSSHLSPGIMNCPHRKPQGSFFSSVLGLHHVDFVPFSLYHFVVIGLCACCSLFGEFFLFFSYPFQHTSFTWITLPTPFEVNSSATFLGYFLSPCSFVSYSPRIVFVLSSFLSLSFSPCLPLSVSFSLFLSFIVEFMGRTSSTRDWSWALRRVLTSGVPGNSPRSGFHMLISVWVHSFVEGDYWMSVYLCW